MSDIVKKNKVLFIFLSATLAGVAVLAYFLLFTHSEMQRYIAETESIKSKIKELSSTRPAPVEENYIRINKDTKVYKEKLEQIRHFFGEPFRHALIKFCQDLGVDVVEFEKEFRKYWKHEIKTGSTRNQAIRKFKIKYMQKKNWSIAWKTFTEEIRKRTSITIDKNNIDDFFLVTLGASRKMSTDRCAMFCQAMRVAMIGLFEERKVTLPQEAANFTFGDTKAITEPAVADVVMNWLIIDDFISRRLVNSGIKSMDSFSKKNLEGFKEGDYIRYRYSVEVTGNLASIRSLVNNLVKAYDNNMVYVVRYIGLKKNKDDAEMIILHGSSYIPGLDNKSEEEIKRIEEERAQKRAAMREKIKKEWADAAEKEKAASRRGRGRRTPARRERVTRRRVPSARAETRVDPSQPAPRGRLRAGEFEAQSTRLEAEIDRRLLEEKKRKQQEEERKPFYQRKNYGKPIIGADILFSAKIDFDFIRYVGFDLNM